jgi:hypothetical protein
MTGGIDWFRWHHGTVTDQKFVLVARRAGATVAEVIAVWACLLEAASMNEELRGALGGAPDFEAMDCALGLADGRTAAIFDAMQSRGLVDGFMQVAAWPKRQPEREREGDHSTERVRAFRQRKRHETPRNAMERQETPREEESREENTNTPSTGVLGCARPADDLPQLTLVEQDRKPAKRKTVPACPHQAILALWAEVLPALPQHDAEQWRGTRAEHLRARWREAAASGHWHSEQEGLAYFRRLFTWVGESRFLTGREHAPGRRPFFAELAWVIAPDNFAKVVEGKYHDDVAA